MLRCLSVSSSCAFPLRCYRVAPSAQNRGGKKGDDPLWRSAFSFWLRNLSIARLGSRRRWRPSLFQRVRERPSDPMLQSQDGRYAKHPRMGRFCWLINGQPAPGHPCRRCVSTARGGGEVTVATRSTPLSNNGSSGSSRKQRNPRLPPKTGRAQARKAQGGRPREGSNRGEQEQQRRRHGGAG